MEQMSLLEGVGPIEGLGPTTVEEPKQHTQISTELNAKVLLGPAGTGKSTMIREMREKFNLPLTATTRIAAYNLGQGASTINSLIGYYNIDSLRRNMEESSWHNRLWRKLKGIDGIVIDEVSMLSCDLLDELTRIFVSMNEWRGNNGKPPFKVLLTGDFLQLPPVMKGLPIEATPPYAFFAGFWPKYYGPNTIQLKHIYRQTDPRFLQALQYAREGRGADCAALFRAAGVKFAAQPWYNYPGMSLYPTNQSVELHNRTRLAEIDAPGFSLQAERWGEQTDVLREIPDAVGFKETCRARVTINSPDGMLTYVNGQLGEVVGLAKDPYGTEMTPVVLFDGYAQPMVIERTWRFAYRPLQPGDEPLIAQTNNWLRDVAATLPTYGNDSASDWNERELTEAQKKAVFPEVIKNILSPQHILPFYDPREKMVAIGAARYVPLVLGYASTFHKSQGLTFDRVQIDVRNRFAGQPQMVYVALSRCRTLEGLTIVGTPDQLARRILTSPAVREFI